MADMVKYEPTGLIESQGTLKSLVTGPAFMDALRKLAPRQLSPERLARMAITAASRNPKLLQCTQESILKAVVEAATLGLDCSGLLGRGYLVPYKNSHLSKGKRDVYEAQFQPGYLGLCDLARRDESVQTIYAKAVFDGDIFEYEEGLEPRLVHKPNLKPDAVRTKDKLRAVYAVCIFADGFRQPQVMTRAEVETHRQRSRAANDGPWVTDYVAMALKTVVRQLCKWIPQTPELAEAMAAEAVDWVEGSVADFPDSTISAAPKKARLKAEPEPDNPSDDSWAWVRSIVLEKAKSAKTAEDVAAIKNEYELQAKTPEQFDELMEILGACKVAQ